MFTYRISADSFLDGLSVNCQLEFLVADVRRKDLESRFEISLEKICSDLEKICSDFIDFI